MATWDIHLNSLFYKVLLKQNSVVVNQLFQTATFTKILKIIREKKSGINLPLFSCFSLLSTFHKPFPSGIILENKTSWTFTNELLFSTYPYLKDHSPSLFIILFES